MKKFFIYLIFVIIIFFTGYFIGKYKPEWIEYDYWREKNQIATGGESEEEQDEIENVIRNIHKDEILTSKNVTPVIVKNKQDVSKKKSSSEKITAVKKNVVKSEQIQNKSSTDSTVKKEKKIIQKNISQQTNEQKIKVAEKNKNDTSVKHIQTKIETENREDSIKKVIIDIDSKK